MSNIKKHHHILIILILIGSLLSLSAFAQKPKHTRENTTTKTAFLYGLGMIYSNEIYKGYSDRTIPLPLIGYQGDNLTVFGPYVSYKIKEFNNVKVVMKLSPRFQGFDGADSYIFKGMKERKDSLDLGIDFYYQKNDWKISVSSMFDALNRSNGYEIKSVINRMFRVGPIFIQPSVSVSFLDSRLVDYYYGVSENEVNQFRNAYIGQRSKNTAIGLSISTPIFFGGYTRMKIEQLWFDSNITNSPLVDGNSSFSFQLFFTKNF